MRVTFFRPAHVALRAAAVAVGAMLAVTPGWAGVPDLATSPLVNTTNGLAMPNIYVILDDSGSMAWTTLPAALSENDTVPTKFQTASQCNGLAYNPNITYDIPPSSGSKTYANATFTAACNDGYNCSLGTTNLNNTSNTYYTYSGSQNPVSYTYDTNGNVVTTTTFYKECAGTSNPGYFTKVTVTSVSKEAQNYANWYTYYRTRINTAKTTLGLAFADVRGTPNDADLTDNDYLHARIGYTSIDFVKSCKNNGSWTCTYDSTNTPIAIATFDAAQKSSFYDHLYGAWADLQQKKGTPTRTALESAGKMYQNKSGPIQYSCQKNYSILMSDGYWNTGDANLNPSVGDRDCGTCTSLSNPDTSSKSLYGTATKITPDYPQFDSTKTANTMADVAFYYYNQNLRPDISPINAVTPTGSDKKIDDLATWLHMSTFTIGLGVSGTLLFDENYKTDLTDTTKVFTKIYNGTANWPAPSANSPTAVDDLWHTAVNGRGTYFSPKDPTALGAALKTALATIKAADGSGAAPASTSLSVISGKENSYAAKYTSLSWTGDILAYAIDADGNVASKETWSAASKLGGKVSSSTDSRKIWIYDPSSITKADADGLYGDFDWNTFSADTTKPFDNSQLSQYSLWTSAQQTAGTGKNLVNYLRGQNQYEMRSANKTQLYRQRNSVLGDIVHAQPIYVGAPAFAYADDGYHDFETTKASRAATLYVGANDGMLHAFDTSGNELWAYVPKMVLPNLWRLADSNYANNHRYFVDGPLASADAKLKGTWATVLVAGLGGGGRGYFALDITDPSTPKLLWTFSASDNANVGYTYGAPIITKLKDGTWVAVLPSGYNNIPEGSKYGSADGKGHLFVLDLASGTKLKDISTGDGSTSDPSGLATIDVLIKDDTDTTALAAYGGDLHGNMWHFDLEAGTAKMLSALGAKQPITSAPTLQRTNGSPYGKPVVYFGTGSYLTKADLSTSDQQYIYAVMDDNATTLGTCDTEAANKRLVKKTMDNSGVVTDTSTVDWLGSDGKGNYGWCVALPHSAERVDIEPQLHLGTVVFLTTIPGDIGSNTDAAACSPGGSGWVYQFDYSSGVTTTGGTYLNSPPMGGLLIDTRTDSGTGKLIMRVVTGGGSATNVTLVPPVRSGGAPAGAVRFLWRELVN
jgi:type IV pilus assembly protein PilY1